MKWNGCNTSRSPVTSDRVNYQRLFQQAQRILAEANEVETFSAQSIGCKAISR